MSGLLVTGTDTDCGKTKIALALMARLQADGLRVAGFKPVAAGAEATPAGLRNDDALRLQARSDGAPDYALVNPYCFEPPIAPHLAAVEAGVTMDGETLIAAYRQLAGPVDRVVVEGAGGWRVPLVPGFDFRHLATALDLPVILVVGMKLGCINHALLSAEAILADGLKLAGWVANRVDPAMTRFEQNLETLRDRLSAPLLGVVPHLELPQPGEVAAHLDLQPLNHLDDL